VPVGQFGVAGLGLRRGTAPGPGTAGIGVATTSGTVDGPAPTVVGDEVAVLFGTRTAPVAPTPRPAAPTAGGAVAATFPAAIVAATITATIVAGGVATCTAAVGPGARIGGVGARRAGPIGARRTSGPGGIGRTRVRPPTGAGGRVGGGLG
jgi:hypothetical protein